MSNLEEHLQRTAARALKRGRDLVRVTQHSNPCELCAPWEGKILSITGKTPGYPTLHEAMRAGLFHPGCRHGISVYIDLDKEIEALEAELSKPPSPKAPSSVGCATFLIAVGLVIAALTSLL